MAHSLPTAESDVLQKRETSAVTSAGRRKSAGHVEEYGNCNSLKRHNETVHAGEEHRQKKTVTSEVSREKC